MSDWVTFRDVRPTSGYARILEIVEGNPQGVMSSDIARALEGVMTPASVSGSLHAMALRGLIRKETRPKPGTQRLVAWFYPDRGAKLTRRHPVERASAVVYRAVSTHGPITRAALCERTGLPRRTVIDALQTLIRSGEVEIRRNGPHYADYLVAEDDDWTPQPFINPIRARALGLTLRQEAA